MREAIRSGKFRSGEHLREADVAKWLNISRTPVREAFHRIISEGLLTNARSALLAGQVDLAGSFARKARQLSTSLTCP